MKKQIEKMEKNNKLKNNLELKIKQQKEKMVESWENKEQTQLLNMQIQKEKNKLKTLEIENAVIKNNIYFMLKNDIEILFKNDLIELYNNEKANKRNFNKLIEKIKEYYKNQKLNIACYISKVPIMYHFELTITIDFLTDEGYKSYLPFGYQDDFKLIILENNYTNGIHFNYAYNIPCFVEDTKREATKLLKEFNKTVKQIEALTNKQKILYHEFTDYLHGALYNELKINSNISIY